jgi:hypothetical protein
VADNCVPLVPVGEAGAGVQARVGEQCTVCGRRHFGVVLQPGQHGIQPGAVTLGGQ